MDQRISRAVAVAALATLPLLTGCGGGSAPADSSSAPASAAAPASSPITSPEAAAPTTPSPTVDTAAQEKEVVDVTEKFVKSVLTIGYPDKSFDAYLERIEPQMTKQGFSSLESAESTKKGTAALKSLYAQRARSAPKFSKDPEVTSLEGDRATAELAYENVAQRKDGGDWKTLKSLGKGTVTVTLVNDGGTWLVENAS